MKNQLTHHLVLTIPRNLIQRSVLVCTLAVISVSTARSQCNGDITLFNQAQVNAFKQAYHCMMITGNLYINGADITNLDSLIDIQIIGGNLTIIYAHIPNLEGLNSLTEVNGGVEFRYLPSLTDLGGLESLERIGGGFGMDHDSAFTSFVGLNSLEYIGGQVYISDMPLILSFNGLSALTTIGDRLYVEGNDMLQNMSGLHNLTSVREIRIEQCASLYSFEGLESLSSLPGGFVSFLNPNLTVIGNLENLKHVGTQFYISFCPKLTSLEGLHLETVTGDPTSFFEGMVIFGTNITDLNGLENLEYVEGIFHVKNNPLMRTLDGVENLRYLNGHVGIEGNVTLNDISVLEDLEFIGGELEISNNDSLSECSIESVCRYIDAPVDLVLIYGNAPGCDTPEEVKANCDPITEFNLIDANLYIDDSVSTSGDIRNLSPGALVSLVETRAAVATDGVSTVLLRMAVGSTGYIEMQGAKEQGFEFPWGDSTYFIDGKNYLFILYTPPDEFDDLEEVFLYGDGIEAYNVPFDYQYHTATDVRTNHLTITHVRPPVVLVHGTYSNPDVTWKTATIPSVSFYDRLTAEGFKVFTVNYKESNGTVFLGEDKSSFAENAKVVWGDVYPQNTGGIKDALTHYRETLGIAVTQADVIGHSLGGILPRVYASPNYNPEYKRNENFMKGDINRLITLGSTHVGSHLGELTMFLNGLTPFDLGLLDWMVTEGANVFSDWVGGASPSFAVRDQLPPPLGTALPLLGRTEIPSHAITLRAPTGYLKDAMHDPDETYYDMYWYTTSLMYQVHDTRSAYLDSKIALVDQGYQATTTLSGGNPLELYPLYNKAMLYKGMIEDGLQRAGTVLSVLDGTFELPSDIEIFKYAFGEAGMGDFADPLLDIFVAGADPVGVAVDYLLPELQFPTIHSIIQDQLQVNEQSMEALRALIFNNDDNDGVVRVQSQSGELEKECGPCVSPIDSVLHGFAPRYPKVQDRMIELLRSDASLYAENGFPAVTEPQKIYYPSESLDLFKVPVSGGAAICQSGMLASHARAFAHIADEQNVIIMTRPVNPDGTEHIANHAATKGMDVKPKSSNWGPQKGFIPVQQRYSKLWKVFEGAKRLEKINEYDHKAQENLMEGVALGRQLVVSACEMKFHVYIDESRVTGPEDMNAEDEVVLVPIADPTMVCAWGDDFDTNEVIKNCETIGPQHALVPMQVLASPTQLEDDGVTPRFFTADYDLLMTGFYAGPDQGDPSPPDLPFQPGVGQITPEQLALLGTLNTAVAATGYRGGNVVHHGPENQFTKSPYIDYPITVFAPDHIPNGLFNRSTDGLILSIKMGPPGFRDLYLKQFVNRMRKEGYDLYHNPQAPGWKWTWDPESEGYELEDAEGLSDYIEELPPSICDKYGVPIEGRCILTHNSPDDASRPGPASNNNSIPDFSVDPTLVHNQSVTLRLYNQDASMLTWTLIDQFGQIVKQGNAEGKGEHTIDVNMDDLGPGMYSVIVGGNVRRVIKM